MRQRAWRRPARGATVAQERCTVAANRRGDTPKAPGTRARDRTDRRRHRHGPGDVCAGGPFRAARHPPDTVEVDLHPGPERTVRPKATDLARHGRTAKKRDDPLLQAQPGVTHSSDAVCSTRAEGDETTQPSTTARKSLSARSAIGSSLIGVVLRFGGLVFKDSLSLRHLTPGNPSPRAKSDSALQRRALLSLRTVRLRLVAPSRGLRAASGIDLLAFTCLNSSASTRNQPCKPPDFSNGRAFRPDRLGAGAGENQR